MQGSIRLSEGRVTVGPHGKISADVDAREVIVRGKVKGAVKGRDRVEVGRTGEIRGDILTSRLAIEEGAQMHSKVEITRAAASQTSRPAETSPAATTLATPPLALKASGESAN